MSHSCSHCGNNAHNSRTCAVTADGGGDGGFMLFGVRVTEGSISNSMRKVVSMNNLSQYDQPHEPNADVASGYASDDVVHTSAGHRERKRGVPWTEEEHRLFLLGLQKVGKGDWRGISRNFVKTRTPTQVASHAQKYFLRRSNLNRRRRRSSLFDMTPDTFMGSGNEEEQVIHQENTTQADSPPPPPMNCNIGFPVPAYPMTLTSTVLPSTGSSSSSSSIIIDTPMMENLEQGHGQTVLTNASSSTKLVRPIPVLPVPPLSKMADLNLNQKSSIDPSPLSLKLSTSSDQQPSSRHSAFQAMTSFGSGSGDLDSNGGSIISVA
ncbi:transcription factor MYB1R1 [Telopea speciosissima]|uniref:transcription factor MYB1R1 n=1 Tax=Telopea speciosissima TaxID=54955 RepID=UPI001CC4A5C8|nr:transcription factor MYB1R1 [Telopea speciosissima]